MSKVFEIRDAASDNRLLGILFYYRRQGRFYAELMPDLDEWSAPFIFSHFVKNGVFSIDSEWTKKWVMQRIIPPDRQNISDILRDNRVKEYDEYKLLLLSQGRCAQDELYIKAVDYDDIPTEISERRNLSVRDVMVSPGRGVYVFFKNNETLFIEKSDLDGISREISSFISDDGRFRTVAVSPGGHGIIWNGDREVTAETLRRLGTHASLDYADIVGFVTDRTADTSEACEALSCSRQYTNQLVSAGRLHPVRDEASARLFLKSELEV